MTNLRTRAMEIKAVGVENRGDFTPTEAPLNIYKYWARNTRYSRVPKRENFCHFWRVVAIWAPLMFLKNTGSKMLFSKGGAVAIPALYVLLGLFTATTSIGVAAWAMAGIPWLFAGMISGAEFGLEKEDRIGGWYWWPLAALTLPISLLTFTVFWVSRSWPREWNPYANLAIQGLAILLVAALVLAFFFMFFSSTGLIGIPYLLGAFIFLGAMAMGMTMLADFIKGHRVESLKSKIEKRILAWEEAYDAEPAKTKKPSEFKKMVKKFFTIAGDIIIFSAQVVRVKKWKICPTMTIDREW